MRTYKIYLNVYDFTPANTFLSKVGMGGYHTGLQIKYFFYHINYSNKQYCYCVISSTPNESGVIVIQPETADFMFNRKIYLGQTKMKQHDFLNTLQTIAKEFTCGKYHMFQYNCNHFSQRLAKQLLGVGVPRQIFRVTNMLNWMCCCLPGKFLSGQWALQSLNQEQKKQREKQTEQYTIQYTINKDKNNDKNNYEYCQFHDEDDYYDSNNFNKGLSVRTNDNQL